MDLGHYHMLIATGAGCSGPHSVLSAHKTPVIINNNNNSGHPTHVLHCAMILACQQYEVYRGAAGVEKMIGPK